MDCALPIPLPVGNGPPIGCLFYDTVTERYLAYVGKLPTGSLVLDVLEPGDAAVIVQREMLGRRYITFDMKRAESVDA